MKTTRKGVKSIYAHLVVVVPGYLWLGLELSLATGLAT